MTYYIQHIHHFRGNHKDDKSLRQELKAYGVDARRLSRFTQLALLGALPLKAYLAEKSGCIQSLKMRNKETNRDLAEFFGNKRDEYR